MHRGKPISRNSSNDSTTSSERRALAESKAQYRAEKNKNRPQRDGTPVGDRKKGGVNTLACAWNAAQQMRKSMPLPLHNRYTALDDDNNATNRASSRFSSPTAHLPLGSCPKDNESLTSWLSSLEKECWQIFDGTNVIDKEENDDPHAGGNQVDL